jgi:hypothetical protein
MARSPRNSALSGAQVSVRMQRAETQLKEKVMPTSTELRQNAEAKFKKKELQRLDGGAALAEYEAASRATLEKTARLRALRLSRDRSSLAPAKPVAKRASKNRTAK